MRRALICLGLFVLTLSAAFAQTKHPFTFEDMMKLKRVGEPVPSPDGKWVLFAAVDVDLAANKKTPHIWIVPLNAESTDKGVPHPSPEGRVGSERVLIPDQDGDRPRWRRMASASLLSRTKKVDRKFGLPTSTARPAKSPACTS